MAQGASYRLLFTIALRSLRSHRVKNVIVGTLLAFGAALLVVGTALSDSVEREMQKSIVSSLAGDLQVYSDQARDPLALFGGFGLGTEDIGQVEDIAPVREALLELPSVDAVVPMGLLTATVTTEGELDRALASLRKAVHKGDDEAAKALSLRVRRALALLEEQLENTRRLVEDPGEIDEDLRAVRLVLKDTFWQDFAQRPLQKLEYLDVDIAPIAPEGEVSYLRILGTDLGHFTRAFERFTLVRGTEVPEGERGLLLNQRFMEERLKLPVARKLDELYDAVFEDDRSIARDPALKTVVRTNARQYGSLLAELSPEEALEVSRAIAPLVGEAGDLGDQLQRFLTVSDEDLLARYRFFYEVIAPLVDLYAFDVGDVIPLSSFTQSGYPRAVNLQVRGVFTFEGLEQSDLAGSTNLIDLVTFRELYGQPTAKTRAELEQIRERAGIEVIPRGEAEERLFGGGGALVEETPRPRGGETGVVDDELVLEAEERGADRPYDPSELEEGLALSAAVVLKEGADPEGAIEDIRAISQRENLGVQVVTWREASGLVGQFVIVVRIVLYVALFIVFSVAVVIINNSLVISTLERVNEIGTLRALGAQRSFVRSMLRLEALFLALLSSAVGALVGVGVILLLGRVGVPAASEVLVFLFGGPRLYPTVNFGNALSAFALIAGISQLAALYPARLATKVPPVVAMQRGE